MKNNEILMKILEKQEEFSSFAKRQEEFNAKILENQESMKKDIRDLNHTITRVEYKCNDNFSILVDGYKMLNDKLDRYHQEHEEKFDKHDNRIINHDIRISISLSNFVD